MRVRLALMAGKTALGLMRHLREHRKLDAQGNRHKHGEHRGYDRFGASA